MVVVRAEPRGPLPVLLLLLLLLLLLQCSLRIGAIPDCNFSSEVSVKPRQIVLTCACPLRSVTDPWLSIRLVSRSWAGRLREVLVNPSSLPTRSPIQKTYAYSKPGNGDPQLQFKCITHGLDHYSHANKDDHYFLTLDLLDHFRKAVSTSTSMSTSASTAKQPTTTKSTTLQPPAAPQPRAAVQQPRKAVQQPDATTQQPDATTQQPDATTQQPDATTQQPDETSQHPPATSQQPRATSQQPRASSQQRRTAVQQQKASVAVAGGRATGDAGSSNGVGAGVADPSVQSSGKASGGHVRSHNHSQQTPGSQDDHGVVVEEEILIIPMKLLILVVICSVLFLMVVALVIFIISKHQRKKQRMILQPPAFCGRQANDDVPMDVLTKVLTRLLPPQQRGCESVFSWDDRCDLAHSGSSSLSGSAYAVCSIPAHVWGVQDDRALGERPGDFRWDPFQDNGFENESHRASRFGEFREHQSQGILFENEVQQASIYDEIDDTLLYDLTEAPFGDDVGEPS